MLDKKFIMLDKKQKLIVKDEELLVHEIYGTSWCDILRSDLNESFSRLHVYRRLIKVKSASPRSVLIAATLSKPVPVDLRGLDAS